VDIATPAERVASNIRAEMARRKRTHAELASVLNLTRSSMHRRMTGEQPLDIDELHKIAAFLGVPVTTLLGEGVAA
jgi:transcriptional regulator with XRE-family HTH domain